MFLSKIVLKPGTGFAFRKDPYLLHVRLEMAFPTVKRVESDPSNLDAFVREHFGDGHVVVDQSNLRRTEESNYLYRLDSRPGGSYHLLMQSAKKPNFDYAFKTIRSEVTSFDIVAFSTKLAVGDRVGFSLRMQPLGGLNKGGPKTPTVLSRDEAVAFIAKRLNRAAKNLVAYETRRTWVNVRKGGKQFQVPIADYEGEFVVRNTDELQKMRVAGLGRGKMLGCGLLVVFKM